MATLAWAITALAFSMPLVNAQAAGGQQVPDAGSILRETERAPLRIPPTLTPRRATPEPPPRPADEVMFRVERFALEGVTLIDESAVQEALDAYRNRDIGFSDLELAMADVAAVYERAGWLARVSVPEQDIVDGKVSLKITEALFGRVLLDSAGKSRISEERVKRTLTARMQRGRPLSLRDMERAVNVLTDTPGVTVSAAFATGEQDGETDVVLTLGDREVFAGSVTADSGGSRSTGAERGIATLRVDNPWGRGEQLGATVLGSTGSHYGLLSASAPLGYDGWRIAASASALRYKLVGSFAATNAEGSATTAGVRLQYPAQRRGPSNIDAVFSLDERRFDNEVNGLTISRKSTTTLTAAVNGNRTDDFGGGGYLLWSVAISAGRVDLSGNADNELIDAAGPRTSGGYAKLAASVARLQRLNDSTSLWVSLSQQTSSKNLDSSEKFVLGGISLVRGYPTSEGAGDSGWLMTAELRRTLTAKWQISPFVDHGQVRLNHDDDFVLANIIPNTYFLSSVGVTTSYRPTPTTSIQLTAARRLGNNPGANPATGKDSDGSLDRTRIWLSSSWYF